jgi:predicted RNase H-like nuclease (RuvC/YqgF family)
MSPPENIDRIIRYVCSAKSALENANSYCTRVTAKIPDLPKAFSVAAQHLSTLKAVVTTIHDSLNIIRDGDDEEDRRNKEQDRENEDDKLNEICQNINGTMEGYVQHVENLQKFFEIVNGRGDNADSRLKKYKKSVQSNRGTGLEKVMQHLLECAISVAKVPLVTQSDIENLEKALDDVRSLTPLFDDCSAGAIMNNFGAGNQFQHNGVGHQNICEDGVQINGNNDNAQFHFQARQARQARPNDTDRSEK